MDKVINLGGGFAAVFGGCACYDPTCIPAPGKPCKNFRKGDKSIRQAQERAKARLRSR